MKGLPEELIYALIFGAVLLLQYLMKRFGPQPEPPPIPQDEPIPEIPEREQAAPGVSPVSAASDTRFGRSGSPSASTTLPQRRFSRKALMANRRDVQNAIVIATIMGPCRAFEPHDIR